MHEPVTNTTVPPRRAAARREAPRAATSLAPLVAFFALTYALTWLCWIPAGLAATGRLQLPGPTFLLELLGGMGPLVSAVLVAAQQAGRRGVAALFRPLLRERVRFAWYLAALGLMLLLELPDLALHALAGGALNLHDLVPLLLVVAPLHFVFVFFVGGGIDEEVGWRGFALPRLQARMHPALASVVLGVLWACWHLPLWFIPGTFQSAQSFPVYLLGVTAASVLLGWIHNGTGSLLLVVLAHSASDVGDNLRSNLLGEVAATQASDYHLIRTALTVLVAVAVLLLTRGRLAAPRKPAPDPASPPAPRRLAA